MDTIVKDPFYTNMHQYFGFETFQDFMKAKTPQLWFDFEMGLITEQELVDNFLIPTPDRSGKIDLDGFKAYLYDSYEFVDEEIEPLLHQLRILGVPMYACSNYPVWYKLIEEKLKLSRFLEWKLVSCHLQARKPDIKMFQKCLDIVGLDRGDCILIDDRMENCVAAKSFGFRDGILFTGNVGELKESLGSYYPDLSHQVTGKANAH